VADLSCDIVVVGAGVLGLCVAAELTARGRDVRLVDPGRTSASAVAAGMIAPAFETLLDKGDAGQAAFLRDAAALWPAFAERCGVALDPTPAEWRGPDAPEIAGTLSDLGFSVERDGDVVRVGCDLRVDPTAGLQALRAFLPEPLIRAEAVSVERLADGWRVQTTAGAVEAHELVIATGAARALPGLPGDTVRTIDAIQPIAGQIGRSASALTDRVVRGEGGYVAPTPGGGLIGATMAFGSRETTPDPAASERLTTVARRLLGVDGFADIEWRGGVRGATADGRPLAGPVGDGLHLALAPRRNGWLLGPLVGRIVADAIEGRPRGSHAAALDPSRFSPREA
jgi:glycine oxidase